MKSLDAKTAALLVVDLQNDTIGEQGAFASSGAAEFASRHGVVERVKRLVDAARAAGMPIVHIHHVDSADHVDAALNAPLFRSIVDEDALVRGTWGAEPVAGLAVEHTCRDGADLGYEVAIVSDATATISDDWQRAALDYALTNIAERVTVDELVEVLRA